ncbi:MAG: NYN domain-containing protein [Anaerolineae bacterium]|nr:NYN domain-containing protein [Anaerolineae bacterium]
MNYLIDGHNLIGKLPDIKLSDPDDEAKLVLKLINWAAVGDNRRVIVVFDRGMPGIQWARFRSDHIKTVFVADGDSADNWLIQFMKREIRDPRQFTLVTSDNAIVKIARQLRIKQISSDQFGNEMSDELARLLQGDQSVADDPAPLKPLPRENPRQLSDEEVAAWLDLFGGEQQVELKPYQRRRSQPEPTEQPTPAKDGVPLDPEDFVLSPDDVAQWLALFGGEPELKPGKKKKQDSAETTPGKPSASNPHLSQSDIDMWLSLFGDDT